MATYPGSIYSFTTINNGDTSDASQVNNPDNEVVAIETGLLNGFQHALKPLTDNTYDLGDSTHAWKNVWVKGNLTFTGTVLGDLLFTDATYDIGKSGATRPRDGFFSRNVAIGGTLGVTGATSLAATAISTTLAVTGASTLGAIAALGTISADVLFTDATYDIGKSGATRPRDIFASRNVIIGGAGGGQLQLADGSVGTPSGSFANSAGMGLYRIGSNDLGIATAGTLGLEVNPQQQVVSPTQFRCVAYNNATQSISDNTVTAVTFNSEDVDVGNLHDTGSNTSRITIPTGGNGFYLVRGFVRYPGNATGQRVTTLRKNGSTELREVEPTASTQWNGALEVSWQGNLVATDYVEVTAYQNSGSAMSIGSATRKQSNELSAVRLW